MKNYIYKLKDETGKTLHGFMEAEDKAELKRKLTRSKLYFIAAHPYPKEKIFQKKVSLDTKLMFTRRLTSLIESGIPILSAVYILWRQTEDKTIQLVVSHLYKKLENGQPISEALAEFPNIFSSMYCAMIAVAEKTGKLPAILRKLGEFLQYQKESTMRIKKATLYPTIVIVFAFLVLICMFTFVVPTFRKVLEKLNVELPLITNIVLGISAVLSSWLFWAFVIFTGIGLYLAYQNFKTKEGFAYHMDSYKLKIPVFGNIFYTTSLTRFIHSLSLLLGAGVTMIQSFEVAKVTTDNVKINEAIDSVQKRIEKGSTLYESFKDVNLFPVMLIEMAGVGETSGSMVPILDNLSKHFDQELEYKQNKIITIIEPALILIVGTIVIFTLLAVYMPIFSIWEGLLVR